MAKYILVHGIRVCNEFIPETFGRLTTIGPIFIVRADSGNARQQQVCQCECGNRIACRRNGLKTGNTKSCGCYQIDQHKKAHTRHGKSDTSEHCIWKTMYRRCYKTQAKQYPDYGGRGITVCDRWREPNGRGFINFLADMGERPSKDYSLDRIDNDGNYEPGNCRWATRKTQNRNQRTNVIITYLGKSQCMAAWAEELGFRPSVIYDRLKLGWSVEKTLTTPVRRMKKSSIKPKS